MIDLVFGSSSFAGANLGEKFTESKRVCRNVGGPTTVELCVTFEWAPCPTDITTWLGKSTLTRGTVLLLGAGQWSIGCRCNIPAAASHGPDMEYRWFRTSAGHMVAKLQAAQAQGFHALWLSMNAVGATKNLQITNSRSRKLNELTMELLTNAGIPVYDQFALSIPRIDTMCDGGHFGCSVISADPTYVHMEGPVVFTQVYHILYLIASDSSREVKTVPSGVVSDMVEKTLCSSSKALRKLNSVGDTIEVEIMGDTIEVEVMAPGVGPCWILVKTTPMWGTVWSQVRARMNERQNTGYLVPEQFALVDLDGCEVRSMLELREDSMLAVVSMDSS